MRIPKSWERPRKVYKGFVGLPSEMTTEQLEDYTKWLNEWKEEYCVEDGRRVDSYDHIENILEPLYSELERRRRK